MKKLFNLRSLAVAATGLGMTMLAGAQTTGAVDVTSVVSTIGAQATPIASIGGAVLAIIVGIKAYKWVRKAM